MIVPAATIADASSMSAVVRKWNTRSMTSIQPQKMTIYLFEEILMSQVYRIVVEILEVNQLKKLGEKYIRTNSLNAAKAQARKFSYQFPEMEYFWEKIDTGWSQDIYKDADGLLFVSRKYQDFFQKVVILRVEWQDPQTCTSADRRYTGEFDKDKLEVFTFTEKDKKELIAWVESLSDQAKTHIQVGKTFEDVEFVLLEDGKSMEVRIQIREQPPKD